MSDAGHPSRGGPSGGTGLDRAHPDVAAWVLGALEPAEAAEFAAHLETCGDCREAVRELQPTMGRLAMAAPAVDLPPGLQARTLAAVAQAAVDDAQGRAGEPAQGPGRTRGGRRRWLAAAAAAVVLGGVAGGLALRARQEGPSVTIVMRAPGHGTASGRAVGHDTPAGWSVALSVTGLPPLPEGQHYECWYAGPDNAPGHPNAVSAGSFEVGPDGAAADVQMWTVVDLKHAEGTTMLVTREPDADPALTGPVVLSGAVPA
jgi:anti-sigma-K factor RskA